VKKPPARVPRGFGLVNFSPLRVSLAGRPPFFVRHFSSQCQALVHGSFLNGIFTASLLQRMILTRMLRSRFKKKNNMVSASGHRKKSSLLRFFFQIFSSVSLPPGRFQSFLWSLQISLSFALLYSLGCIVMAPSLGFSCPSPAPLSFYVVHLLLSITINCLLPCAPIPLDSR